MSNYAQSIVKLQRLVNKYRDLTVEGDLLSSNVRWLYDPWETHGTRLLLREFCLDRRGIEFASLRELVEFAHDPDGAKAQVPWRAFDVVVAAASIHEIDGVSYIPGLKKGGKLVSVPVYKPPRKRAILVTKP